MLVLSDITDSIRNWKYMAGVERDSVRIRSTGEVFTPTELVQEMLNSLPNTIFTDPKKTFLDPSCGDGQFLGEVVIRKVEELLKLGIEPHFGLEIALETTYGVELMPDNVFQCRERLLCGRTDLKHIVEKNIVCTDALQYHYRFDGTT
jgi:hypothetical protein